MLYVLVGMVAGLIPGVFSKECFLEPLDQGFYWDPTLRANQEEDSLSVIWLHQNRRIVLKMQFICQPSDGSGDCPLSPSSSCRGHSGSTS